MKTKVYLPLILLFIYSATPLLLGIGPLRGGGCENVGTENDSTSLVSIAVTPRDQSILVNASEQYTATGTYSDG